ncbi:MAG TPA: site-specific DNA-methyltransferase [Gemmatimonadales bacterium]|nr:site-specific DNA-methyltransferase [Gemmatimonadales bacterium]
MTLPLFKAPKIVSKFSASAEVVLHCGDTARFVVSIPDEAVMLVITSPPYNLGKEYETPESIETYLNKQEAVIRELVRVLSPRGSLCWQVGNYVQEGEVFPLDIYYYDIFKRQGLQLRNRIIWHFEHGLHASRRFSGRYETLLWFTKSRDYVFNLDSVRVPAKYPGKTNYKPGPNYGKPTGNPLGKNPGDRWAFVAQEWDKELWDIPNVKSNHPEKTVHPCQFPIELVERCVLALTNPSDWVFDPYAGVGSALIAALRHGRRAAGSEKEGAYVRIAKRRIEDFYAGALKIRPLGRPVWQPTGREKVSQAPEEWEHRRGNPE